MADQKETQENAAERSTEPTAESVTTDALFAELAELPEANALAAKEAEARDLRTEVERLSDELRATTEELGKHVPKKANPFDEPTEAEVDTEAVEALQKKAKALQKGITESNRAAGQIEAELPALQEQLDAARVQRMTAHARQLYRDYCERLKVVQDHFDMQVEEVKLGIELARAARQRRQEYNSALLRIFEDAGTIGDPGPMEGRMRKEAGVAVKEASMRGIWLLIPVKGISNRNGHPLPWSPCLPENPDGLPDTALTPERIQQLLDERERENYGDPRPQITPTIPGVVTTADIGPALEWRQRQQEKARVRREDEKGTRPAITTGSRTVQERVAAKTAERDMARAKASKKPKSVITTNGQPEKPQKPSGVITTGDVAERKAKRGRQSEGSESNASE